mmetsp:Transcript_45540/g.142629  ORF Transcript_45540/g.142629 Transcript_45540/m.142629 type:complete len:337 (+) Transcript_45540:1316-2326(+)
MGCWHRRRHRCRSRHGRWRRQRKRCRRQRRRCHRRRGRPLSKPGRGGSARSRAAAPGAACPRHRPCPHRPLARARRRAGGGGLAGTWRRRDAPPAPAAAACSTAPDDAGVTHASALAPVAAARRLAPGKRSRTEAAPERRRRSRCRSADSFATRDCRRPPRFHVGSGGRCPGGDCGCGCCGCCFCCCYCCPGGPSTAFARSGPSPAASTGLQSKSSPAGSGCQGCASRGYRCASSPWRSLHWSHSAAAGPSSSSALRSRAASSSSGDLVPGRAAAVAPAMKTSVPVRRSRCCRAGGAAGAVVPRGARACPLRLGTAAAPRPPRAASPAARLRRSPS